MALYATLEKLRTLFATTAKWQSMTGEVTPGAAEAHIYFHRLTPVPSRPFMVITPAARNNTLIGTGTYQNRIGFDFIIEVDRPADNDFDDQYLNAWAQIDTVVDQTLELAGTSGHPILEALDIDAPRENSRRESDEFWQFRGRCTVGPF